MTGKTVVTRLPKMTEAEKAEFALKLITAGKPSVPWDQLDRSLLTKAWLREVASRDADKEQHPNT